jgi:hypothetical protein
LMTVVSSAFTTAAIGMLRAKAAANTSAIVRIQGLPFFSAGTLSWQRSNNVGVPLLF